MVTDYVPVCAQGLCRFLPLASPRNGRNGRIGPLQLVKEAQALHVRSEMAALATEAKALMDVDPWLAPEPPHPPGGTRLPHLFGALAHERMLDLVRLAITCIKYIHVTVKTSATKLVPRDSLSLIEMRSPWGYFLLCHCVCCVLY